MSIRSIPRLLAAALALAIASAGAGAHEFTEPFSYFANRHDIRTVLTSFARTQGLTADFASGVSGKVSGRFKAVQPKDFLRAMEEAYDVSYYVLAGEIHFYRMKDSKKDFLTVRSGSGEDLVASLRNAGFIADELPVRVNPQGNMLTMVGPPAYLEQLRNAASAYQAVLTEKIVMRVFPVKHAWADDITVSSMDSTVTVPGIATILRGMVMGQSVSGQSVSQQRQGPSRAQSVEGLGAPGLSRQHPKEAPAPAGGSPVEAGTISIMADPRVNAVLVSDAAYRMPYYEEVIRELDKPVELIEIHAAIVDIDTNASRDLGINFNGVGGGNSGNWQGGGSIGAASGTNSSGAIQTATSSAGALLSTIYTHGSDYFLARVSAMESNDEARMLGRPSVLTIDNVQATLENTTTYYIPLQGTEAVDLYKVEAGTVLRVTPHIIRENGRTSIKLAVNVQDDQNDSSSGYQTLGESTSGSVTVSPIKQTKINTQAIVDAGQSLLIGGYYYEQKQDGESGVPLLKDIPLLGNLFKASSKKGRLMERLILITPRLVTPDGANVPARVDEPAFSRSPTQADYETREPARLSGPGASRAGK